MAKNGSRSARSPDATPSVRAPSLSPSSAGQPQSPGSAERASRPGWRDDPRRFFYSGFDLLFALGYLYVFAMLMPNRLDWARSILYVLPAGALVMMMGTVLGRRVGWWLTIVGGTAMLVWSLGVIMVLLTTASYLSGVYGAFGKAAAMSSLLSAAFVVQFAATLPALQLGWAMTRVGRRGFGLAPVWPRSPGVR